jgi:hypothetical protein
MKLCIDCRHFVQGSGKGFERCNAPQNVAGIDPVTGEETEKHWNYCETHRLTGPIFSFLTRRCGKRARWFESKDSA